MSIRVAALSVLVVFSPSAFAQDPTPYGPPIALDHARKLIAAAEDEAKKQKWPVAIAVVDSGGHLVAFARLDNTQLGSIDVALEKAKCAALFRRSTKVFEDGLTTGGANNRVLRIPGVIPVEGGIPIIHEGKLIGAIGVSGVKPSEDGQIAQAGSIGDRRQTVLRANANGAFQGNSPELATAFALLALSYCKPK